MAAIVISNLMIFLVPYSTVRVTAMYLEKGRIKIVRVSFYFLKKYKENIESILR